MEPSARIILLYKPGFQNSVGRESFQNTISSRALTIFWKKKKHQQFPLKIMNDHGCIWTFQAEYLRYYNCEWASVKCLTASEQYFSALSMRWWRLQFTRPLIAWMNYYSASSLKQHSMDRHTTYLVEQQQIPIL